MMKCVLAKSLGELSLEMRIGHRADQDAVALHHSLQLPQRSRRLLNVLQRLEREDGVECFVGKSKKEQVADGKCPVVSTEAATRVGNCRFGRIDPVIGLGLAGT